MRPGLFSFSFVVLWLPCLIFNFYMYCALIKRKPGFSEKMFWSLEIPFKTGFTVYIYIYIYLYLYIRCDVMKEDTYTN